MTVQRVTICKELEDLRTGHPGCQSVILADLSTGMVLASSTAEKTTQEKLDDVCRRARDCLGSQSLSPAPTGLSDRDEEVATLAWHFDGAAVRCYIKAPAPAEEALCLVASPDAPLHDLCHEARQILLRITAEG
jgi:hypothetical protein